jgi:hypothetical protein
LFERIELRLEKDAAPSERARRLHPILGHKLPISLTKSIRVDLRLVVEEIIPDIQQHHYQSLPFWSWGYVLDVDISDGEYLRVSDP